MRTLHRKLIRDMLHMKGQVIAISLVVACGIATFVMSLSTLDSLRESRAAYYERYRFPHVFVSLKRAPEILRSRFEEIPGVRAVELRIVTEVTLDMPGMEEPAVGRLISVPESHRPRLCNLHLRSGRYVEPGRDDEVIVSEAFADAHSLKPGDAIKAILNGRLQTLRIVGVALSPEYVFQIRGGEMLPDDRRFGVFWMGESGLAAAFDMTGAFNNALVSLMRGASEEAVIERVDDLLEQYGGLGAYGRDEHVSDRYLSDEIRQLRGMGMIAPSIFLGVAALLLNIVLSRLVGTQREQIAALKAFGYSNNDVARHYLGFVVVIVLVGTTLGTAGGIWMAYGLTGAYAEFYRFPVLEYRMDPGVAVFAFVIALVAGVLGTLIAVRRAAALPPAEAMRPEPPKSFRATIPERLGLTRFLSPATRMILRNLERQPMKSGLSMLGIAMAVGVLVLGNFMEDSLDYLIDQQFQIAQRQDLTVALVEPAAGSIVHDLEHLPGVIRAEPIRAVAARMTFGHRSRRVGITGLRPDMQLFQLLDASRKRLDVPPEGLLISEKLSRILEVQPGQSLTVEVLQEERPTRSVPVAGLIDDFSGLSAYMSLDSLNRMMREGETASGLYISADALQLGRLYSELKSSPHVAAVTIRTGMLNTFRETIAENLLRMKAWNVLFASVIAIGVVYNSARVSLSERSRDLATLRVIGFTRREISLILLGELAVLTAVAIPVGLLIGRGLAELVGLGLDTELYRIPLIINADTYGFATIVTLLASVLAGLIVRRRLDRLDLVAVLKTRE
ncbi:MAG: FtsX-like permease family protein [Rhodopirellula sp.]|nr:FtsX-like permease family protein [Rhodopirellula sp.]